MGVPWLRWGSSEVAGFGSETPASWRLPPGATGAEPGGPHTSFLRAPWGTDEDILDGAEGGLEPGSQGGHPPAQGVASSGEPEGVQHPCPPSPIHLFLPQATGWEPGPEGDQARTPVGRAEAVPGSLRVRSALCGHLRAPGGGGGGPYRGLPSSMCPQGPEEGQGSTPRDPWTCSAQASCVGRWATQRGWRARALPCWDPTRSQTHTSPSPSSCRRVPPGAPQSALPPQPDHRTPPPQSWAVLARHPLGQQVTALS